MPRLYVAHRAQALARELAIRLEFKPQSRPLRFEPDSRLFLTISSNCSRSAMGRAPMSRARAKNKVLSAPASRLPPPRNPHRSSPSN